MILAFLYWKIFGRRFFPFTFSYLGRNFFFNANNRVDFATLSEVFVDGEYRFPYSENPRVIIDLGANVGDTAIFYALSFPEAKIYAVEPNPKVHQSLELNTKQFSNVTVCKCAIADSTGKMDLFFGLSHLGSSLGRREQNTHSVSVDTFTLEDFCKKYSIDRVDILKFDIEGAEEYLLRSPAIKSIVKELVGEIHEDLTTAPLHELVVSLNLKDQATKELTSERSIVFGRV
jgi:FkbM family methyltransferase